jgi:pimeloyl-ACP methyl ester carboxylesterase
VGGGLDDRSENGQLAVDLAERFTVYNYDRRGRGASGDTPPYTLVREIEDVDALIAEAGGSAHLYGVSSGGALALEAAATGLSVVKVAVYEVPYPVAGDMPDRWRTYVEDLRAALADERRGDAIELFMRLAGSSEEEIAGAKSSPFWPTLVAIAHTLAYDAACPGEGRPPADRFARISQPILVLTGGMSVESHMGGLPPDFYVRAADEIVEAIAHAERLTLDGQGHVADPKVVARVLERFFGG